MYIPYYEYEYETVAYSRVCASCNGDLSKCNGRCNGTGGYSLIRREPKEIAKIKAERKLQYENDILEKANKILVSRKLA